MDRHFVMDSRLLCWYDSLLSAYFPDVSLRITQLILMVFTKKSFQDKSPNRAFSARSKGKFKWARIEFYSSQQRDFLSRLPPYSTNGVNNARVNNCFNQCLMKCFMLCVIILIENQSLTFNVMIKNLIFFKYCPFKWRKMASWEIL